MRKPTALPYSIRVGGKHAHEWCVGLTKKSYAPRGNALQRPFWGYVLGLTHPFAATDEVSTPLAFKG